MEINQSKTINAWCMYDWANSVYAIVIKSSIFPVFYNTATQSAFESDIVNFFGFHFINTALYSFAISLSFYDVTEKLAVVIGTFSYGFIEQLTASMRNSTIALGLFFAVGIGFLLMIRIPSALNYNKS